ncbi:MAG: NTP transferase domain-containing protein [Candidatus Omnitrophica bacterium]|nr:NTP transferase domain-containing protein [Candidatus Omnitrophota bacterium]
MQVVILAGGLGTRLRALTNGLPKSLVPVAGKPFLHYQLEWLASSGISEVVLCLGRGADPIEAFARDGRGWGIRVRYSREETLLGTAGALKRAEPLLEESFGVLNGDSFLPMDLSRPVGRFQAGNFDALMVVCRNKDQYDKSNVRVENGFVTRYSRERLAPAEAPPRASAQRLAPAMEFIDNGFRIFRKKVLDLIPAGAFVDLDLLYQRLIEQNRLAAAVVREPFYEVGSPQGWTRFCHYVEKGAPVR